MTVTVSSPQPGKPDIATPGGRWWGPWILLAGSALGALIGALIVGLKPGGFLTVSDVGQRQELAAAQKTLRQLDACAMDYAARGRRGIRRLDGYVHIRSCSGTEPRVRVNVGDGWARKGVGFELKRSAMDKPWKILVEKAEVPLPELSSALNEFTPIIVANYDAAKRQQESVLNEARKAERQDEATQRARQERAKASYPK